MYEYFSGMPEHTRQQPVKISAVLTTKCRGVIVEYRLLGRSGFKVPALSLGTGTFGGVGEFFGAWGNSDVAHAKRLIDICLDAGLNMFDSADGYSDGAAESILGEAIKGRRDKVIISTKATFRSGQGINDIGSSRFHLLDACDKALQRLQTDYIDVFQLHNFDAMTPVEETLSTLNDLVRAGKIRYIGVSNFSGWHLMKSLAVSDRHGWSRYVVNQAYYSLIGREYEWELMPLALDQGIGTLVWSPLGWARLTGKIRRGQPRPEQTRLQKQVAKDAGPQVTDEYLFKVVDVMDQIANETGKSIPQIAINWLLQRPAISSVIIGARNEQQLKDNLGAIGWQLNAEQIRRLDAVSYVTPVYPYWHQRRTFSDRNPPPV